MFLFGSRLKMKAVYTCVQGWVLLFPIFVARPRIRVGVCGLVLVVHLHGPALLSGGALLWTYPIWKCVSVGFCGCVSVCLCDFGTT